jgi:hypothetical protein
MQDLETPVYFSDYRLGKECVLSNLLSMIDSVLDRMLLRNLVIGARMLCASLLIRDRLLSRIDLVLDELSLLIVGVDVIVEVDELVRVLVRVWVDASSVLVYRLVVTGLRFLLWIILEIDGLLLLLIV